MVLQFPSKLSTSSSLLLGVFLNRYGITIQAGSQKANSTSSSRPVTELLHSWYFYMCFQHPTVPHWDTEREVTDRMVIQDGLTVSKLFIVWALVYSSVTREYCPSPHLPTSTPLFPVMPSQVSLPWRLFLPTLSSCSEVLSDVYHTNSTLLHHFLFREERILGLALSLVNKFCSLPFPVSTPILLPPSILPLTRSFSCITAKRGFLTFLWQKYAFLLTNFILSFFFFLLIFWPAMPSQMAQNANSSAG